MTTYKALVLPGILILAAVLYIPGLQGPMLLDDFQHLDSLLEASDSNLSYLLQHFWHSSSGPLGRPVAMLSFILDSHVGGGQVWVLKATNLALHLGTTLAAYWLLRELCIQEEVTKANRHWLPLFVTAIWVLHPLQVSTVMYTVQRMTILASLFTFLALAAYVHARRNWRAQSIPRGWLALSFALFFPLAIFSKETALLTPAYIVVIEWTCFSIPKAFLDSWRRLNVNIKVLSIGLLCLIATLSIWFVANYVASPGYAVRSFTMEERVLTESRILVKYLWQILAPSWSTLGFFHDDIPLSTGFLSPPTTLASVLLIIGLVLFAIASRARAPLASFGLILFFVSHLLESTIFPLELMFEHRNYLGSFGIVLALTTLIAPHIRTTKVFIAAAGLVMLALSLQLLQFTYTWGNQDRLHTQIYSSHPDSPSAIAIMADRYIDVLSPHLALELLDRPERLGFKLQSMVIKCNLSHKIDDKEWQAVNARMRLIESYELTGFIVLANKFLDKECEISPSQLLHSLENAIAHTPDVPGKQKLMIYQAHILHEIDRDQEAISALDRAYMIHPSSLPLFIATDWLITAGDKTKARDYYRRALSIADKQSLQTAEQMADLKNKLK